MTSGGNMSGRMDSHLGRLAGCVRVCVCAYVYTHISYNHMYRGSWRASRHARCPIATILNKTNRCFKVIVNRAVRFNG